jgi:hypothetical protein
MDIVSLFLHIFVGHYNVELIKASTDALIIFTNSILDQTDFKTINFVSYGHRIFVPSYICGSLQCRIN